MGLVSIKNQVLLIATTEFVVFQQSKSKRVMNNYQQFYRAALCLHPFNYYYLLEKIRTEQIVF